jgi:hypothetical protein
MNQQSLIDKSLSANAPVFVPHFIPIRSAQGRDGGSPIPSKSPSNNAEESTPTPADAPSPPGAGTQSGMDVTGVKEEGQKKKKAKKDRTAPRKRRPHQRGKSDAEYYQSPGGPVDDDALYEHVSLRREAALSLSHQKSKSDGNISLWFDEIKQRRISRLREASHFSGHGGHGGEGAGGEGGGEDGEEAASLSHTGGLSLIFSQPEDWVFGHDLTEQQQQQCLEDADYVAEELERKKWQHWAQCAVRQSAASSQ